MSCPCPSPKLRPYVKIAHKENRTSQSKQYQQYKESTGHQGVSHLTMNNNNSKEDQASIDAKRQEREKKIAERKKAQEKADQERKIQEQRKKDLEAHQRAVFWRDFQ